jgi:general secretion pathway protein C
MLRFSGLRPSSTVVARALTLCVWAVAAASVAFWVLRWPQLDPASAATVPVFTPGASPPGQAVARALGHQAEPNTSAPTQTSSQHQLLGVIASTSGQGSALIAVDGQPPKAYRVGQSVQEGWTLVSLTARQARLKSNTAEILLELPVLEKP